MAASHCRQLTAVRARHLLQKCLPYFYLFISLFTIAAFYIVDILSDTLYQSLYFQLWPFFAFSCRRQKMFFLCNWLLARLHFLTFAYSKSVNCTLWNRLRELTHIIWLAGSQMGEFCAGRLIATDNAYWKCQQREIFHQPNHLSNIWIALI